MRRRLGPVLYRDTIPSLALSYSTSVLPAMSLGETAHWEGIFKAGWRRYFRFPTHNEETVFYSVNDQHEEFKDMVAEALEQAPDNNNGLQKAKTALLLIDVINDLNFDGGEKVLTHALPMAISLSALKRRAKAAGMPAIYVNDNFGRWRSDFAKLVRHCSEEDVRGRAVVAHLLSEQDDYFVLKPKHSAFFQTNLECLLGYLGASTLMLTGMAGDICVLFSANDAYMRDFKIFIPSDCVASEEDNANEQALGLMQRVLKANTSPSSEL